MEEIKMCHWCTMQIDSLKQEVLWGFNGCGSHRSLCHKQFLSENNEVLTCVDTFIPRFMELYNKFPPLKYQPERSKREDRCCNNPIDELDYLCFIYPEYISKLQIDLARIQKDYEKLRMRCSEHYGNIVRDK